MAAAVTLVETQGDLREKLHSICENYSICPEPQKSYPLPLITANDVVLAEIKQFLKEKLQPTEEYPNRRVKLCLNTTLENFVQATRPWAANNEATKRFFYYDMIIELQSRCWGNKNLWSIHFATWDQEIWFL